jgi:tetratricopeptide (TPR) repeat protein
MDKRLERKTNEHLRDVPCNPEGLKQYVSELSETLKNSKDVKFQVKILGEMGVHLRSLNELDLAKNKLNEALKLIRSNQLGIKLEIQQKIRFGHVLQWQGLFNESNILFESIISVCRTDKEVEVYLDFALQHSGKNFFEQKKYLEALKQFEEALSLRLKRNAPLDQIESTKLAIQLAAKKI